MAVQPQNAISSRGDADRVVVGDQIAGAGQRPQLSVGQQVKRLARGRRSGGRDRPRPTAAAPAAGSSGRRPAAGVCGSTGQRRTNFAHERARLPLPPTSANAWRTRSRAAGLCCDRDPLAERRAEHELGAARERAVQAGHRGQPAGGPPDRAPCRELVAPVQPVGHQHQPRRLQPSAADGQQRQLGAEAVAGDDRSAVRPPRGRSRRSRRPASPASTEWRGRSSESPCSGRSGSDDAEARRQRARSTGSHSRCESPSECSSTIARPGAGLAVGDPRAVLMVVQPQLHAGDRRSPPRVRGDRVDQKPLLARRFAPSARLRSTIVRAEEFGPRRPESTVVLSCRAAPNAARSSVECCAFAGRFFPIAPKLAEIEL